MDIIHLTIIDREDFIHLLEAPVDMGLNLMEICKASDLPVMGTCGGMALCSSCHIYILSDHTLPEKTEAEENMLDQTFSVKPTSRLGCQLKISPAMNELVAKLAPESD